MAATVDGGPYRWTMAELQIAAEAARAGPPVVLRLNHEDVSITSSGVEAANVGEVLELVAVRERDGIPAGLAMRAMLHPSPAGWLLRAMQDYREWMALSIGGDTWDYEPGCRVLKLAEISLVREMGRQLDPGGLVVAAGERAQAAWQLLTEGAAV